MGFIRSLLVITGLTLLLVFVQGVVLSSILPTYMVPNLILTLVVFLAFFESTSLGALLTFLAGLVYDVASGSLLGPWAASFVIVFALFSSLSQRIFVESFVAGFLAVSISSLIVNPIYAALHYGFDVSTSWTLGHFVIQGIASGLFAPFVIRFLKRILKPKDARGVASVFQLRASQPGRR